MDEGKPLAPDPQLTALIGSVLKLTTDALEAGMAPQRVSAALMTGVIYPAKTCKPDNASDKVMKASLTFMLVKTYDDMQITVLDTRANFHPEGGKA